MSFFPLVFLIAAYTGMVKLAARLLRRTQLRWRDACIFSLIVLMVLGACALLNRLSGNTLPLPVSVAAGLIIQCGIGAWYLGPRARAADGAPLQARNGAMLALVAYGLVAAIGALCAVALIASRS
jgi:ABC-type uncharacterized transport system permease subunit